MKLQEFEKYMDESYGAYWTSFYMVPRDKSDRVRLHEKNMDETINQIDYIGLSVGNESLMINLTVWAGELADPIEITSKMLGSNRARCFEAMNAILEAIETCYYSVNSNK